MYVYLQVEPENIHVSLLGKWPWLSNQVTPLLLESHILTLLRYMYYRGVLYSALYLFAHTKKKKPLLCYKWSIVSKNVVRYAHHRHRFVTVKFIHVRKS